LASSSWDGWADRFRRRGFNVLAPAWPGLEGSVEQLRADPTPLAKLNIEMVVGHYDRIVRELDSPPIIIGHSFGGLFAQLLAYRGLGAAVVGLEPGAPAGVLSLPFSTLKAGAPVLANPFNVGGATMLTPEQFRYAFTNTVSDEESQALYDRYAIPCANRVFFEGAFENFAPHSPAHVDVKLDRPPILLITGGADHLVTAAYTKSNFSPDQSITGNYRVQRVSRPAAFQWCSSGLGSSCGLCPRLGDGTRTLKPGVEAQSSRSASGALRAAGIDSPDLPSQLSLASTLRRILSSNGPSQFINFLLRTQLAPASL